MRRFHEFTLVVKESRDEFADIHYTRVTVDLNTVTSFWEDVDNSTCIETETDQLKVTQSYDEVAAVVRL